ncbi:MAG TPA: lipopolysaccharide transport periplasmic protein LptA [Gammaproteobacteria bacterium]|nr:lipopolysaccharide transport periplasmic protein LptA [Gammaproteobacteria bacterium]
MRISSAVVAGENLEQKRARLRHRPVGITSILVLCILAWALPQRAYALKSDARQPINITADRWDHTGSANGDNGTSVYTGHVVITQGSIRITADQATLTLKNGKLKKAVIVGSPATFYQAKEDAKPVHGHAREIHYDTDTSTVELIDNARVDQGGQLITANYIRYNTQAGKVIAHRAKQKKGRVHIVIPPKDNGSGHR